MYLLSANTRIHQAAAPRLQVMRNPIGNRKKGKENVSLAWWNRRKQPATPSISDFNPAADEASLDRCVRRLREILEELGPLGQFLEKAGEQVNPGPDSENRLAEALKRVRIPGFCGYKLVVEAWTLMELIGVRVITLRKLHGETGTTEKIRKLDEIQGVMEEVEPMLRKSLAAMEIYSSLDGNEQAEAMPKRYGRATE